MKSILILLTGALGITGCQPKFQVSGPNVQGEVVRLNTETGEVSYCKVTTPNAKEDTWYYAKALNQLKSKEITQKEINEFRLSHFGKPFCSEWAGGK